MPKRRYETEGSRSKSRTNNGNVLSTCFLVKQATPGAPPRTTAALSMLYSGLLAPVRPGPICPNASASITRSFNALTDGVRTADGNRSSSNCKSPTWSGSCLTQPSCGHTNTLLVKKSTAQAEALGRSLRALSRRLLDQNPPEDRFRRPSHRLRPDRRREG